ncbi:MAG: hypothetical protein KDB22_06315 [Planctomycetales bacterium]|nr:hypothetical protein [Planctomycetales bacterium]
MDDSRFIPAFDCPQPTALKQQTVQYDRSSMTHWKTYRQFSLWLLVVVAVFGVGRTAGWYLKRRQVVSRQREIVKLLDELNAHYYFDFQLDLDNGQETLIDLESDQAKVHWLARLLGDPGWCHDIFYVSFAQFDQIQEDGGMATGRPDIGPKQIDMLTDLKGLKWLALIGTGVTDESLRKLSIQLEIERLWLSQTGISDLGVSHLGNCPQLTHLFIEGTQTTDASIRVAARLPCLQVLSAGSRAITSLGLTVLAEADSLQELYLDQLPADDRALLAFGNLAQLKRLSLRQSAISGDGLKHLEKLSQLEQLRLDGTRVTDESLEAARGWPRLQELSLAGTAISDTGLGKLAPCSQLVKVELSGTRCTLGGIIELLVGKQRKSLAEALTVVFATRRNKLGDLISLDLKPITVNDNDIDALRPLKNLQWLEMPNNSLTDLGVDKLVDVNFPQLSLLRVDNSSITDRGFQRLLQIGSLRDLHISNCQVSETAVQQARRQRPSLRITWRGLSR